LNYHRLTTALFMGASSLAIATGAAAQGAPQLDIEEVIVTGSRIVSDGAAAPTPVTVATTEALARSAPTSIPDGLNQLPQFAQFPQRAEPRRLCDEPGVGQLSEPARHRRDPRSGPARWTTGPAYQL
jgi:hypothetical protein